MKKWVFFSFVLLILFLVGSCQHKKKPETSTIQEIKMSLDSSLVGLPYHGTNPNISIDAPRGWIINEHINESLSQDTLFFAKADHNLISQISFGFTLNKSQALCLVSSISGQKTGSELIDTYEHNVLTNYNVMKNSNTVYKHNDLIIHQLMITKKMRVDLKLLVLKPDNTVFMIDYILPAELFQKLANELQSSIASISKE